MKLKIVSDGTNVGTKVIDEDTGEELQNKITSLSWELDAKHGIAKVQLGIITGLEATVAPEAVHPLLGMFHGKEIYEYDRDIWRDPAFASAYRYAPTKEELELIVAETRALLRI